MAFSVVILGSGRGSNAEALLKAEAKKKLGMAKIAAIISDNDTTGILSLGQKYKVPAIYIDPGHKGARLSKEAERAYVERIELFAPKLIVLAGFMRILNRSFIDEFQGKIINLHPSLLPSFPGTDGIKQAFNHGVKITGCTVHWVTPDLDAGPIIDQKTVRISEKDTLELVEKKVHAIEHQLLPDVVALLSEEKIRYPS